MLNLESRLWATAALAAESAGMTFTVPCADNVRDLVRAGVAVMRRAGRISESDLEAADASLATLTAEMVRVTRAQGEIPATGPVRIRETALVAAKRLCPLWPFG